MCSLPLGGMRHADDQAGPETARPEAGGPAAGRLETVPLEADGPGAGQAKPGRPEGGVPGTSRAEARLDEDALAADPVTQFSRWLADAAAVPLPEPTAMVLATISAEGLPRARTVLLKSHDQGGFIFYTNRTSRKGTDLVAVPRACLLFPWHAMHRQVIIEGTVTPLSTEQSEPYFRSRPRGSQLGAWASRQSSVIGSRAELDDRYQRLAARWPDGTPVPMPEFWGGYRVVPVTVEFWQGRLNRLHDRFRYRRLGGQWVIERQAP
jgi:pyridoxamine 5'-phosphate oxidase